MVECGLSETLRGKMAAVRFPVENIQSIPEPCTIEALRDKVQQAQAATHAQVGLGISLIHTEENHIAILVVGTPAGYVESTRSYGGERALSGPWAVNSGLEMLRRALTEPVTD
jgi:hypothetical protein